MTLLAFETLLPQTGQDPKAAAAFADRTYGLDWQHGRLKNFVEGLGSIRQCAYKILATEAGVFPIYSENYGIVLEDLIGMDAAIMESELKRRIREALIQDERIYDVTHFQFRREGDGLHLFFSLQIAASDEVKMEWRFDGL